MHPIIIHVCTRKESEKGLSYIAHFVTLEKAPCNVSARFSSKEQLKLHASWIKLWSLKCPSLTILSFHSVFYEVVLKWTLCWSIGNTPWFSNAPNLPDILYLRLISGIKKWKCACIFVSYHSVLSEPLSSPHNTPPSMLFDNTMFWVPPIPMYGLRLRLKRFKLSKIHIPI